MTQNSLFLCRLMIVTHDGRTAYDETFHRGVNIIRGHNSSGKSTIIRFIFYALGGCYGDFVPEAMQCREVLAEVLINGIVFTLKRYLEPTVDGRLNKEAPMYIYYGDMASALADRAPESWQKYGYKTTALQRSFSNVLFGLLGLPEFKADSNITMHQILRLMYLDQESPLSSLFFFESFDRELTRETVAALLMGLYDEQLSSQKMEQAAVRKKIEDTHQAIKITKQFLGKPELGSPEYIMEQIRKLTKDTEAISRQVMELRGNGLEDTLSDGARQKLEYQRLQDELRRLRTRHAEVAERVSRLQAEIGDSEFFVEVLESRIQDITRSMDTRQYFGQLHLEYCPECLSKIAGDAPDGCCRLCKSPIDNTKGRSQAMRIKLQLDHQRRDSVALLEEYRQELQEKKSEKRSLQRQLTTAQRKFDAALGNVRGSRDDRIDQLLQDKGYKEREMAQYHILLESAEKYQRLLQELKELSQQDERLIQSIAAAEGRIRNEQGIVMQGIRANGIYLLKNDQICQEEFRQATDFKISFKQNMVYLNDPHVKLSASSSYYLKMSARYAIFLTSLQNSHMLYPRLLFSDNMEDKGMEPDRAHNFQRIVIRRIKELGNPDYQLIFATSLIAPELDTPEYTIGDFYTQDKKSLDI